MADSDSRQLHDEHADTQADNTDSDDMDYEPAVEDEEDEDEEEEDDQNDEGFLERFLDEVEGVEEDGGNETILEYNGIQIQVAMADDDEGDDATQRERTARQRRQILRLLANSEIRRLFRFTTDADELDDEDEDDADFTGYLSRRRIRRERPDPNRFPKVPSDEGTELMNSGIFGSNEVQAINSINRSRKKKLAMRILDRELATEGYAQQRVNQRLMAQGMIPSSNPDTIIHYEEPVYSGQFSDDGNFFFSVNKDFHVRMYDTSNPYSWRYYKTVEYPFGQWTLTDASLSPDNKYLAYTSIRSTVCLAPTDPNDLGDPYNLDLSDTGNGGARNRAFRARFGNTFAIWSIRFSGDGRELVAGADGGVIVVYDIESRRTLHRIAGHEKDVNAVCFADSSSPHILYSGSDDTTIKVWDTRSMGDSREAGAFVGHIEGLTYIDSKGDGRKSWHPSTAIWLTDSGYILSNGKDQSMKLWDLRMVMSPRDFRGIDPSYRQSDFDYRWATYDEDEWYRHPNDNSVVTFRGHRVLRTLIRCHFSPPGSTNSRYVYSGSEDGKVYIWNMDATLAGKVDVYAGTRNSRPPYGHDMMDSRWSTCVRDASWHPNAPMIVASALNGYGMENGTCSIHAWNDGAEEDEAEPKMGLRVNPKLEVDREFYEAPPPRFSRITRGMRGTRRLIPDD